jgi:hypothetical protein
MKKVAILLGAALAVAACQMPDIRGQQQAECKQLGGYYHQGEDPDDDVCAITRENVILFDNREVDNN